MNSTKNKLRDFGPVAFTLPEEKVVEFLKGFLLGQLLQITVKLPTQTDGVSGLVEVSVKQVFNGSQSNDRLVNFFSAMSSIGKPATNENGAIDLMIKTFIKSMWHIAGTVPAGSGTRIIVIDLVPGVGAVYYFK